ncbi:MAG: inositol 2-dehydrogenase [Mesorhizobium sp.]|nr:MAG: inositol 2-dehydrogenase [Mesorhizobium sp.]
MTLRFALLGAGRIGKVHARAVASNPQAKLVAVADAFEKAATELASAYGAEVRSIDAIEKAKDIDAVIICTPTDTHADLIERFAKAGKAIFCEKPIDLDIASTDQCLAAVEKAGVPLQIGFNRRFDPSFAAVKKRIDAGEIGAVEQVIITSRDPEPETEEALAGGGGVFREMTIHDFDMARFLLGDYDTAMFILRTASGRQCHINNSVRAVYGYDQRIEVHGAKGMLQAGNRTPTSVSLSGESGIAADRPLYFFVERYAESYEAELDHFIQSVAAGRTPAVGAADGRKAMILCEAALASAKSGRFEPVRF